MVIAGKRRHEEYSKQWVKFEWEMGNGLRTVAKPQGIRRGMY